MGCFQANGKTQGGRLQTTLDTWWDEVYYQSSDLSIRVTAVLATPTPSPDILNHPTPLPNYPSPRHPAIANLLRSHDF